MGKTQGSYIGSTAASQAAEAGSTPVPCSRKEPTFVEDKCGFFSTKCSAYSEREVSFGREAHFVREVCLRHDIRNT